MEELKARKELRGARKADEAAEFLVTVFHNVIDCFSEGLKKCLDRRLLVVCAVAELWGCWLLSGSGLIWTVVLCTPDSCLLHAPA